MFGQNNNHDDANIPDHAIESVISDPAVAAAPAAVTTVSGDGGSDSAQQWQHPGAPLDATSVPVPAAPAEPVVTPNDLPLEAPVTAPEVVAPSLSSPAGNHDLIDIKQQALSQLSPLVGHLDQTPEEKFRTTMMMIQATDDQSLVKSAYEAAGQITDEKAKAQALLDIVNEINYFTSQHTATDAPA